MSIQWERREQEWTVQWFKLKYPNLLIVASANGGQRKQVKGKNGKMWSPEAANLKREGVLSGFPDLQICCAKRNYHGLFIEMKAPGGTDHVKGRVSMVQKVILNQLNCAGYYALVCWGYEEARKVIDWYLQGDASEPSINK